MADGKDLFLANERTWVSGLRLELYVHFRLHDTNLGKCRAYYDRLK